MDEDEPGTGDESSAVATQAVAADALALADQPWAAFDRWGGRLFVALALLTAVVGLLVVGPLAVAVLPLPFIAAQMVILVVGAALLYAVAVALGRRWAWARLAAMWLLVAITLTGFLGSAADLTVQKITIPLAAIAAVLVLLRKPGPLPTIDGRDRRTGTLVGVVFVVASVLPSVTTFVFTSPASPLVASQDDLDLALHLDCPPRGTAMPERIEATATWRWLRRDPFAVEPDTVGIGWRAPEDEEGNSSVGIDGARSSREDIAQGGFGLSMGAVDAALRGMPNMTWTTGPTDGRLPDGSATVVLIPTSVNPATRPTDGILSVTAVYAHGNRWTVTRDEVCRW